MALLTGIELDCLPFCIFLSLSIVLNPSVAVVIAGGVAAGDGAVVGGFFWGVEDELDVDELVGDVLFGLVELAATLVESVALVELVELVVGVSILPFLKQYLIKS